MINELKIRWCSQCSTYYIVCPICNNNLCNGGGGDCCKPYYNIQDLICTTELINKSIRQLDWDKTKEDFLDKFK